MKQTLSSKTITWVNLGQPRAEELAEFVREVNLSPLDAEFIVHEHHRPEITVRPNYLLLLIQVPVFDRQSRLTSGVPLYVLVANQSVWTLHHQPIAALQKIIDDFNETPARQEEYFDDYPVSLGLYIVSQLYASAFRKLERLNKYIEIAADAVFQGNERKMVEEIAVLTRDVTDFRKVMRPQRSLFSLQPNHPLLPDEVKPHWSRLDGQAKKLWEILESLSESVKELGKTNTTLLQHKENELLRLLTIYSIIAIPAWILITPFSPSGPDATTTDQVMFWGILGILVITLIGIFLRFRGKRLL